MSINNLSQVNLNSKNENVIPTIKVKKESNKRKQSQKQIKNLSNQLGFSFDDGEIKTANEIEMTKWLKDKKVTLLSKNKDNFSKKLSQRFLNRNLINNSNENNLEINNLEQNLESSVYDDLDNFENSSSETIKLMYEQLKIMQSYPLEKKIEKTISVLEEAAAEFGLENLVLGYSGGKDSEVLSHIIKHHWKKDILHIFSNTTCEFPETLKRVREKAMNEDIDIVMVSPDMSFNQVVKTHGFPMISKNISKSIRIHNRTESSETEWKIKDYMERREKKWVNALGCPFSDRCCDKLKKEPMRRFQKAFGVKCAIVGTTAEESRQRTKEWIATGCNSFNGTNPKSMPLSIWTEKDIWEYIDKYNVKIAEIYKMGYNRNGCLYCGFGVHLQKEGENRIKMMKNTHPHAYGVFLRNYAKYFDMMKELGYSGFEY